MAGESGVVLEAEGLTKIYGHVKAVDDVSFKLREGETLGIVGPNGAGKTTLLNLISGAIYPDKGRIRLTLPDGRVVDVTRMPPHRRVALGLAKSYQIPNIFENLTVIDNLRLAVFASTGRYLNPTRLYYKFGEVDQEVTRVIDAFGLGEKAFERARNLSHGERKILDVALAYILRPRVLLLDEPTSGLSVAEKENLLPLLRRLPEEGISVIIVEHDLDVVFELSDRVILMNEGRVILEGPPEKVRESRELRVIYLGKE